MNATDKRLLNEVDTHLQLAARRKVIYLEDKVDAKAFCALLGVAEPLGQQLLHQGVFWGEVLRRYAPYTAFNRLVGELQERLRGLGFGGFMAPILGEALLDGGDIAHALEIQQPQLLKDDLAGRFTILLGEIERLLRSGTDEGHALINGKWLMEDYAPRQTRLSREDCWSIWIEHVRSNGGLPEVRQFWERVTGNLP